MVLITLVECIEQLQASRSLRCMRKLGACCFHESMKFVCQCNGTGDPFEGEAYFGQFGS